jgi:putative acetyltransferase
MFRIELRDFRTEDIQAVSRIWYDAWQSTGLAASDGPAIGEFENRLVNEGMRDWRIRVACRGPEVLGFLALDTECAWLRQIFVRPAAQRAGVGALLLHDAKRALPGGFWLRTDTGNRAARRFYERHGLAFDGEVPHPVYGHMVATYRWRGT